jgi:eukaryotic-like serine/threonine-protein kinase
VAGSHRTPVPQRRTFSSGQRALLWAAGVLGALAIVIAILIVLNAQDRKDSNVPPPTVTNTSTTVVPPPPATPGAMPDRDWTEEGPIQHGGGNTAAFRPPTAESEQNFR